MWVSLVAIGLLFVALFFTRELQLAERLQSPRVTRISWALGLLTLAVILVGGYVRQERKLAETWKKVIHDHKKSSRLARGQRIRFRADLVDIGAYEVRRSTTDGCDGTLGKDAMAGCTQEQGRPRKSMAFRQPYIYRCVRVEVPARGSVEIEATGLRDDEDLAGFFVRQTHTLDGLTVMLPGQDEPFTPSGHHRRQHFHAKAQDRQGDATIRVHNDFGHAQPLCFALAAAEPVD
jgi:hypothetical protein